MRFAAIAATFSFGFVLLLVGVLAVRLAFGPIAIEGLSQRVAAALNSQIGAEWRTRVGAARIDHAGLNPALTLEGVEVFSPNGQRVLFAPVATVAVDPWSLVWGRFRPRSIVFRDTALRLGFSEDGEIDIVGAPEAEPAGQLTPGPAEAGGAMAQAPGEAVEPAGPPRQLVDVLARGAGSFIELLTTSDGFLGGIDTASVEDARVTLVDQQGRPRFRFTDTDLQFSRPKDNLRNFSFELTGGKGRWRLEGAVSGRSAEKRIASISFANVPVSDLLAFNARPKMAWTDMPLSGSVSGAINGRGELTMLTARVDGAGAVIHTDDPDMPQFTMDRVAFEATWREDSQRFDITRLFAAWDGYHVAASGALERGGGADEPWRLRLRSDDALAAPYGPDDAPTPIRRITAQLAGVPGGGARIDDLAVETDAGTVSVKGQLGGEAAGDGVALTISGAGAKVRAALALWPAFAARHVRDYIGRTFSAGLVESFAVHVRMTRADILRGRNKQPMTPGELAFDVVMNDAEWRPAPGAPAVRVSATASGNGAEARILAPAASMVPAEGQPLALTDGVIVIHSAMRPVPAADISFNVAGDLPTLLRVMDSAGLGAAPVNPVNVRGAARLAVSLRAPLSASAKMADIRPVVRGSLGQVRIDDVLGDLDLDDGAFTVDMDGQGGHLAGAGKLAGASVDLDVREMRKEQGGGEVVVSATLDEEARARLGLSPGSGFSGPVSVTARFPSGEQEATAPRRVEVDLAKARIDNPFPGWTKAAGKPGKLSFLLQEQAGATRLSDIVLDAGNLSASGGAAEMDDRGLQKLRFSAFRMSSADSMRIEVDRADGGYRVHARGRMIDARPVLRAIVTDEAPKRRASAQAQAQASGAAAMRIDLVLSAAIVAGFNNEALTNVSLKLGARGGEVVQATMSGSLGAASASLRLAPDAGAEKLEVRSTNAGALLRFADIYRRMYGGDLMIDASLGRRAQSGSIDIARFTLRDEPALARIVASQPAGRGGGINVSEVAFTRLQGWFDREGGRVQLRDGIIWGPQLGIKLDGVMDFARDQTDLAGTFIPAYALNNAFARIPLFGPLIGGGANEGMFAVSFRITGPASAPTLTVNPLTAVAPGILRKFLEVFTPDGAARNQGAPGAGR